MRGETASRHGGSARGAERAPVGRERSIAALAARQHGVVARRQLLAAGLGSRAIENRIETGRLHRLHRSVYALGHGRLSVRGRWMAAVLAGDEGALLSHRSAAALWGLMRPQRGRIEVTSAKGRSRGGIAVRKGRLERADRACVDAIPVTSVARTIFDLAEVVDQATLARAFEEADRLGLLDLRALEALCARGRGRRALRPIRSLVDAARAPEVTRSELEDRFAAFCRERGLPPAATNVSVLGREVDALWPDAGLIVELDGYAYHRHRAAFERDRARDAAMLAAGYRVIRLTHRRIEREPEAVASQLRRLLGAGHGRARSERGQGTVEWVALVAVVALLLVGMVAVGVWVPGAELARAVASRILCATALAERCGDEPALIAAYGEEVGKLARERMPALAFERGARALPVDFRRCRQTECADGTARGLVDRTDAGLPVTAFVRVIDCREGGDVDAPDCSGARAGNLYLQYWLYYADSATMRGVPIAAAAGYHRDDWESVQVRISPDGRAFERASSHHGYNHARGIANWGSDAGVGALRDAAERVGARPRNGWGPAGGMLRVSGGSHAGNTGGYLDFDRIVPGPRVHLVPLEQIAAAEGERHRFAVSPPWRKRVWRDPEATGTD